MVVRRGRDDCFEHRQVVDLTEYLGAGDLLVLNDTRVIPSRVHAVKEETGGRSELLFLEEVGPNRWEALCRASRQPRAGTMLRLAETGHRARVIERKEGGGIILEMDSDRPVLEILAEAGEMPLPPYIHRESGPSVEDTARYQTVYARNDGAIAAPTAGLHFTNELLCALEAQGVRRTAVTLHVGVGTFRPVTAAVVEEHVMESERYTVSDRAADMISETRSSGGRVVAVGTTTVRTLETVVSERGSIVPCAGRSSLFIRPPYRFGVVDALLTNFHLPKSTLTMMVSAMIGRENLMRAYCEAIDRRYRFYSYGDSMLIL